MPGILYPAFLVAEPAAVALERLRAAGVEAALDTELPWQGLTSAHGRALPGGPSVLLKDLNGKRAQTRSRARDLAGPLSLARSRWPTLAGPPAPASLASRSRARSLALSRWPARSHFSRAPLARALLARSLPRLARPARLSHPLSRAAAGNFIRLVSGSA